MKCPTCPESVLVMSERQGVEIDYCPTCRGVWLDRGELDKIIERAGAELAAAPVVAAPAPPRREDPRPTEPRYDERRRDDDRRDDRYAQQYPKKKKKKTSFLEDLFEF